MEDEINTQNLNSDKTETNFANVYEFSKRKLCFLFILFLHNSFYQKLFSKAIFDTIREYDKKKSDSIQLSNPTEISLWALKITHDISDRTMQVFLDFFRSPFCNFEDLKSANLQKYSPHFSSKQISIPNTPVPSFYPPPNIKNSFVFRPKDIVNFFLLDNRFRQFIYHQIAKYLGEFIAIPIENIINAGSIQDFDQNLLLQTTFFSTDLELQKKLLFT